MLFVPSEKIITTPSRLLRYILEQDEREYTYIILGTPGRTGKTWLCNGLRQFDFNAIEISESIFDLVFYIDIENHFIVDESSKIVTIVLNKPL